MRKASLILLLAAVAAAGLSAAASADRPRPPAQVFNSAAEPGTLQAKLDRALAEASKTGPGPFWIGYAIDRLQGERSHIGSFSDGDRDRGPTIADILAGRAAAAAADSHGGGREESGDGRPRQDRRPGQAGEEGPQGARLLPEIQAREAGGPRRRPDEQPRAAPRLRGGALFTGSARRPRTRAWSSSPPFTAATPARRSAKT